MASPDPHPVPLPEAAPDVTRWPLIWLLWGAGLLAAMQFAKIALTLEPLALRYPGWPVAYAVSAVAVMGVVFGTVAGGVVARIGPSRAILICLGVSAVAGGAQVLMPAFPLFMALRVAEGAGHLGLVIALPTLMAGLAAVPHRALVMGLWATFFGVGFALAAVAVPLMPTPQAAYGVHALCLGAITLVLAPRLPRHEADPGAIEAPNLIEVYRRPRLVAPGVGHGLYAALFLGLVTFLPVTLGAPWLGPVLPLVGIVGSLGAGWLARIVSPTRVVPFGFAGTGVLFGLAALAWGAGAMPLALILASLAVVVSGGVAGAGFAAVPVLNPYARDRARANGVLAQLGNVGTFTSAPLFVALGPGGAMPGAALVALFACGVTAWLYAVARTAPAG